LGPAQDAATQLGEQGISTAVIHLPTVKPLDNQAILDYAASVPVVVTVEEHTIIGGLGSGVAELIAEANFDPSKRFKRMGIPDTFADEYGSQDSLMARYGITIEHIVETVRNLAEAKRTAPGALHI